ncbi:MULTISPECIES: hypothetical protein [Paenibacillus]|uniref:hypothetical protein n=1 Tax=Paenibacillus TaxID=44249 RepID=UPI0022B8AEF7|nr:hypothetical protein [Paenibacillus caseinilyticus]MCZ8518387.1 hypothetical protein [Paenibacillus caseinilyticus]
MNPEEVRQIVRAELAAAKKHEIKVGDMVIPERADKNYLVIRELLAVLSSK